VKGITYYTIPRGTSPKTTVTDKTDLMNKATSASPVLLEPTKRNPEDFEVYWYYLTQPNEYIMVENSDKRYLTEIKAIIEKFSPPGNFIGFTKKDGTRLSLGDKVSCRRGMMPSEKFTITGFDKDNSAGKVIVDGINMFGRPVHYDAEACQKE